jgi:hypothetical protein
MDKHSSLLQKFVNCGPESFIIMASGHLEWKRQQRQARFRHSSQVRMS